MSLLRMLPLVNWNNGIIMIVVFAAVCIALITALVLFMNSGKNKKST
ncbi:hypothetical protein [Maribacter halichondriae]|nr:hypothetical protein [Maribacter sp. Hal144]